MMNIVEKLSEDGLSRTVWRFRLVGFYIVLDWYAEQTRPTKRHKFKGKFWESFDERSYHSSLSRPEGIPEWVYMQALRNMIEEFKVAVGFPTPDRVIATIDVNSLREKAL